tara:strand:+ start:13188 stop:14405 length:1218 start_codon:yes stop_codon:yes gene_type:complete
MKILVYSQYFWPETFRINEVCQSLVEMGHQVEVITGKPNYPLGKLYKGYKLSTIDIHYYKKIKVYRLPIITRGLKKIIRLSLNYLSYVVSASVYSLFKLLRNKYDFIYIYGTSPIFQAIPGIIFGKIKSIPVVLNVQDLWPESLSATGYIKSKFILKAVNILVSIIYKQSDLILVSSRPFIEVIKKYNTKADVKYLPNSVDHIFIKNNSKENLNIELGNGFNVVFAGNLGSAQSIKTIVSLAEGLVDYKAIDIFIFGEGSEFEFMNEQKKMKNLRNLHLMGRKPLSLMPIIFSKSDVLLATLSNKKCFSNTLPNKIQAYMTAKKPIIVSMNGEGAKIIDEAKCGKSVPAENVELLINSVLEIYNMSIQDRKKLSENAYKYFNQNFSHENLMNKLEKEFIKLKCKK